MSVFHSSSSPVQKAVTVLWVMVSVWSVLQGISARMGQPVYLLLLVTLDTSVMGDSLIAQLALKVSISLVFCFAISFILLSINTGTYSSSRADSCIVCPAGYFCPRRSPMPFECQEGYWSPRAVSQHALLKHACCPYPSAA